MATFNSDKLKQQLKIACELTRKEEWQENEKIIKLNNSNDLEKKYKVQRGDLVMMMVMKLRHQMEEMINQCSEMEKETKELKLKVAKYDDIKEEFQKMEKVNEQIASTNRELCKKIEQAKKESEESNEKIKELESQIRKEKQESKEEMGKIGNEMKEVEKIQNQTYAQVVKQGWASKKAVDAEFSRCMNSVIIKYDKEKAENQDETCSSLKQKLVDLLSQEKVVPSDSNKGVKAITKNQLKDNIEIQKLPSPKQEQSKYSLQFRVILKKKYSKKAMFSSLKHKKQEWKGCVVKNETPANLLRASISLEKVAWKIREKLKYKTRVITDAKERCLKLEIIENNSEKGFKECGKLVASSNENIFEGDHNISEDRIQELIEKAKDIMEK